MLVNISSAPTGDYSTAAKAVYQQPADPKHPLICFDETPVQLVSEKRKSLPMKAGKPERYDYEYRREGTANLFMFFAPELATYQSDRAPNESGLGEVHA